MAKEIKVSRLELVYQDPFSLSGVYKFVFYWLMENGYVDNKWKGGLQDVTSEEELEIFYSEENKIGGVREYRVWWRAEKPGDSPYFKWKLNVDFQGLAIKDTEVVRNDKKYKMQIGEITMRLKGVLVIEANGSWEGNSILKQARKWFTTVFYRAKIEAQEDMVYEDLYRLQNAIKNYFEMTQWEEQPELFFNRKGFD